MFTGLRSKLLRRMTVATEMRVTIALNGREAGIGKVTISSIVIKETIGGEIVKGSIIDGLSNSKRRRRARVKGGNATWIEGLLGSTWKNPQM